MPRRMQLSSSNWRVAVVAVTGCALANVAPPARADEVKAPPQEGSPAAVADSCCHDRAATRPAGELPMDRKSVLLRDLAERLCKSQAPFFGEGALQVAEQHVRELPADARDLDAVKTRGKYGDLLAQYGRYEEAIAQFELALVVAKAIDNVRAIKQVTRDLGIAWMRMGERANCVARHNQDSCLFPLKDGAIHVDRIGSEQATRCFLELLERIPDDYATMWLLNVVAMTLGTYPESVPEPFRIPPEKMKSEHELPRMFERAKELGFTGANRAGGSILDDFDGDGRMDVVVSSMDLHTPLRMWLQRDAGRFEEVSERAGLSGQLGGLQLFHFDADNDGRLDLLVQRGGWMGRSGELPNSLLMQQADGTFVDRTHEAGIEITAPSQAAAIADVDLDGDLDLFLGYEGMGERYPSKLFLNDGAGNFSDGSRKWGIRGVGFVKGCAFGDYDGDGWQDLYISTMNGPNRLYQNQRGERFVDVAPALKVDGPSDSFSCFFLDYDNDGWLDLWASAYPNIDRPGAMGRYWVDGEISCEVNRLYRNNRRGGFDDVTEKVALDRVAFPMGSSFGDIDNDGFDDIYLATGAPDYATLFPNVMYRNAGGKRFQDVTATTGTGMLQKGHGVAFGDLDGDGDLDLFAQTGGAFFDDTFANGCYVNPGHGHRWLTVRTRGTKTNRFGLGVRVNVRFVEGDATREVFGFVGGCSRSSGRSRGPSSASPTCRSTPWWRWWRGRPTPRRCASWSARRRSDRLSSVA